MKRIIRLFASEECGQDLVEYTLLIAFVALSTAGLFMNAGANADQAWSSANSVLATAAADAGGAQPAGGGGGGGGNQGGGGDGGGHHGGDGGGDGGGH
ncbi:MAG TPA: hypothetical protein VKR61_26525 [Bryobacteraceae bacterium]|nr:hypothetical protein [Bryobacteraceae bacterium]